VRCVADNVTSGIIPGCHAACHVWGKVATCSVAERRGEALCLPEMLRITLPAGGVMRRA